MPHSRHLQFGHLIRNNEQYTNKKIQSNSKRSDYKILGYNQNQWNTLSKLLLFIIACISITIRCYHLYIPDSVAFDEVHTGTEINNYLKHEFFFDYNPPLGKLILAGMAYLSGYDGSFPFEYIGRLYTSGHERSAFYISLRAIVALSGALISPLLFIILIQCNVHYKSALFASCLVLFDNASCLQSKFIMHDAFYYIWVIAIALSWIQYKIHFDSLSGLCICAIFVGCAMSTKYIGWSVYFAMILMVIMDRSNRKNLFAMAIIPLLIYICTFYLHLSILYKSGSGNIHVSMKFKQSLYNDIYSRNKMETDSVTQYMDYVTLLNIEEPIHLHSHLHSYPLHHYDGKTSSQGQQVTGYDASYIQDHDIWIIEKANQELFDKINSIKHEEEFSFDMNQVMNISQDKTIYNGDIILLRHYSTEKYLLTHDVASPLTKTNTEVTVVELNNLPIGEFGDILWKIELFDGESILKKNVPFNLLHLKSGVRLNNHQQNLPDWGFEQREINGIRDQSAINSATKWIIDYSSDKKLSNYENMDSEYTLYSKFSELQRLILYAQWNIFIKPGSHPFSSSPVTWPLFTHGISMWDHLETGKQIYFLPNILSWWLAFSIGVLWFSVRLLKNWTARKKGCLIYSEHETSRLETVGTFLFFLYLSNYLPYLLISGISVIIGNGIGLLFIHYYIPSFVLSCLLLGLTLDGVFGQYKNKIILNSMIILLMILVTIFIYFLPLTLSPDTMTVSDAISRQWLPGWNFAVIGF